jgi:hypothetical protein
VEVLAFYRGPGERRGGVALTPLKTGEGLRGDLREGK